MSEAWWKADEQREGHRTRTQGQSPRLLNALLLLRMARPLKKREEALNRRVPRYNLRIGMPRLGVHQRKIKEEDKKKKNREKKKNQK